MFKFEHGAVFVGEIAAQREAWKGTHQMIRYPTNNTVTETSEKQKALRTAQRQLRNKPRKESRATFRFGRNRFRLQWSRFIPSQKPGSWFGIVVNDFHRYRKDSEHPFYVAFICSDAQLTFVVPSSVVWNHVQRSGLKPVSENRQWEPHIWQEGSRFFLRDNDVMTEITDRLNNWSQLVRTEIGAKSESKQPSPAFFEGPALEDRLRSEKWAMRKVMAFERKEKRKPRDVSKRNLGFDIRSADSEGKVRLIEVKAYHGFPVELTRNEWGSARKEGNRYYLYVVTGDDSETSIREIQNPSSTLEVIKVLTPSYRPKNWKSAGKLHVI